MKGIKDREKNREMDEQAEKIEKRIAKWMNRHKRKNGRNKK